MKIKSLYLAGAMAAVIMTTSCSSKKQITYFQDLKPGQELVIANLSPIKLQPNDKVSIVVSTGDSRLNSLFNLPVARTNISQGNSNGKINSGGSESTSPYTLDSQGDINFPVLGKLHVAGMTREELGEYIRRELISRDLAKNPIVTVEYLNLSVTVLGEVGHPGRFAIDREDYTILDALSAAGDLTIFGQRDNIRVLREENGVQRVYDVNLNSGLNLTQSPVYYLQQNDVIYVEPNDKVKRQTTPNGESPFTPAFWMSVGSFGITIATLVITLTN